MLSIRTALVVVVTTLFIASPALATGSYSWDWDWYKSWDWDYDFPDYDGWEEKDDDDRDDYSWDWNYDHQHYSGCGHDYDICEKYPSKCDDRPVPEPSAALVFAIGSLVVGHGIRRRRRSS